MNPYESPPAKAEPPEHPQRLGVDALFLIEIAGLVLILFVIPFFIIPLFHQ